ncbi:MAG: hypothetical protein R3A46_07060 [Thermomicrobiales bacterium]
MIAADSNTICVDVRANNVMGSGNFSGFDDDIILNEGSSAKLDVEQTSAANVTVENNGASVYVAGTPNFGASNCPSP